MSKWALKFVPKINHSQSALQPLSEYLLYPLFPLTATVQNMLEESSISNAILHLYCLGSIHVWLMQSNSPWWWSVWVNQSAIGVYKWQLDWSWLSHEKTKLICCPVSRCYTCKLWRIIETEHYLIALVHGNNSNITSSGVLHWNMSCLRTSEWMVDQAHNTKTVLCWPLFYKS